MGHGGDVINELSTDHQEVHEFFARIEKAPPAGSERKQLADQLTIELVRHSVAEEEHLYPAVRQYLPGGDALADKEIADHGRVEELLKTLEGLSPDDPDFNHVIVKLRTEVEAHIKEEETVLFARLRTVCDPSDLEELGDKVRTAKKRAPTRPHPGTPSTPPANRLLAPGVGLVDRARDFVTGRGK
ncbi:hemerythrin domain-containing protein [Streptomyces sp. NPDC001205]